MSIELTLDENTGTLSVAANRGPTKRPKLPSDDSIESVQAFIDQYLSGPGQVYFVRMLGSELHDRGQQEFKESVDWVIQAADKHKAANLYSDAAHLLSYYSRWFCLSSKGEDKGVPLGEAVSALEKALALEPLSADLNLQLLGLVLGRPQSRNLERARSILDGPALKGKLTTRQKSTVKIFRESLASWEKRASRAASRKSKSLTSQ